MGESVQCLLFYAMFTFLPIHETDEKFLDSIESFLNIIIGKLKFYRNYLTLDFHKRTVFGGTFALITHHSLTSTTSSIRE